MSSSEHDIDTILTFLDNDLAKTERNAFEDRLKSDASLRHKVDEVISMIQHMDVLHLEQLRAEMATWDQSLDASNELATSKNFRRTRMLWLSLGAAAAVFVAIFLLPQLGSSSFTAQQIVDAGIDEPGLPVRMSIPSKWDAPMNAYKTGDFERAQTLLTALSGDTAKYFLGVIAFRQAAFDEAREQFEGVNSTSTWHSQTRLFRALSAVADQPDASADSLRSLASSDNYPFQHHAERALKIFYSE